MTQESDESNFEEGWIKDLVLPAVWATIAMIEGMLNNHRAEVIQSNVAIAEANRRTEALRAAMEISIAEANERTEAVRTVLIALTETVGPRAIDRRKFQEAVRRAAAEIPNIGPQAARHTILLEETQRVLELAR